MFEYDFFILHFLLIASYDGNIGGEYQNTHTHTQTHTHTHTRVIGLGLSANQGSVSAINIHLPRKSE